MTRFMTIDRMQNYFVVVIRAWKDGGASRLLHFGVILTEEELRASQLRYQVADGFVFEDCGYESTQVYSQC